MLYHAMQYSCHLGDMCAAGRGRIRYPCSSIPQYPDSAKAFRCVSHSSSLVRGGLSADDGLVDPSVLEIGKSTTLLMVYPRVVLR